MGKLRLLPIVSATAVILLVIKVSYLILGPDTALTDDRTKSVLKEDIPGQIQQKHASAMMVEKSPVEQVTPETQIITGAADKKQDDGNSNMISGPQFSSTKSEFAILQSLSKRRKKLDEREKQLILQRNLLKAAESRLERRIAEIKRMENRISANEKNKKSGEAERYRKLVEMYSKMKPSDAAKIFNRLDLDVLAGLVQHMNSRSMAAILSSMDPAKAERLTLKIANQGLGGGMNTKSLPKINTKRK